MRESRSEQGARRTDHAQLSRVGVGITLAQTNWFRNKTDFKVERATIGFLRKYVCFPAVRSAETL